MQGMREQQWEVSVWTNKSPGSSLILSPVRTSFVYLLRVNVQISWAGLINSFYHLVNWIIEYGSELLTLLSLNTALQKKKTKKTYTLLHKQTHMHTSLWWTIYRVFKRSFFFLIKKWSIRNKWNIVKFWMFCIIIVVGLYEVIFLMMVNWDK